ncbi:MAG: hypothetical protein WA765_15160 [Candidatus Acidiferrum sp.]
MLRNRFLILLAVCFLAASAAWADDIGYVDCSSHSDGTQVFGKPRKTPDVVANLACGERFTVLVYGFYFSRIQTRDGQVGYVYSNLIALDHGVTSLQQVPPQPARRPAQPAVQQPSLQMAAEKTKLPRTSPTDADSAPAAPAQPQPVAAPVQPASDQPASAQPSVTPTPAPAESAPAAASPASTPPASATSSAEPPAPATQPNPPASAQPEPAPASAQPQPEAVASSAAQPSAPDAASSSPAPAASPAQPDPAQPTSAQPPASTSTPPAASSTVAEATPPAPQPEPAAPQPAAAQPEPAPAQPAPLPAPIRPADKVQTWEKPRSGGRTAPLIELYGGYSFARMGGASNGSNLNGALGSFGWNPKSWLQVVADTSYSFETVGATKNVLYGNHFGPRFFYRSSHRWGFTPFVEGLVGGSSERTTISGTTTSTGSALSYKVGGGIDIHPSRHWDVRLFDVDYYRTTFGAGTQSNNYWISAGVVLRLFGGSAE